ncbi:MAG: pitrilysin family protein [Gemmatimonadota bacterium]|nr:pitrilysin family protein [Gemmatimonadota bacterium]
MNTCARGPLIAIAFAACPLLALQAQLPIGRAALDGLDYPTIDFRPPIPDEYDVAGVPVLLLEDHALPLVSVYARFKGGYGLFGRESYAAGTALPSQIRYGGTKELSPDSVDKALEYYAIQTSFGGAGEALSATMNTLVQHLPAAMELWGAMLAEPAFDSTQVEIWRARQRESIRRRADNPGGLAFSEFNRLLYGDHPIGWEMEDTDLSPELLSSQSLAELHRRVVCRENLVLGLTGDMRWQDFRPLLEAFVRSLPACEGTVPPSPIPDIREEPGVYLIEKDLEQSVIVMAHTTDVRLADDSSYYSATIGNSILGGGGFSSRILSRVRTEAGFAYSASSLWTMPRRYDGLLGAITRTSPENTIPAIELILETMEGLRTAPPEAGEVQTAVERIVNGFVFNFETPGRIVSRTMFYLAQDLPSDWLERYLNGIQRVTAEGIHDAFARHLRPAEMMILIVGDPDRIGRDAIAALGPVTVLDIN